RLSVPLFVISVVPPNDATPAVAFIAFPGSTVRLPFTRKPTETFTSSENTNAPPKVGAVVPDSVAIEALPVANVKVDVALPRVDAALLTKLPTRSLLKVLPSMNVPAETVRLPLTLIDLPTVNVLVPALVRS